MRGASARTQRRIPSNTIASATVMPAIAAIDRDSWRQLS
jgi:hypothetical protein